MARFHLGLPSWWVSNFEDLCTQGAVGVTEDDCYPGLRAGGGVQLLPMLPPDQLRILMTLLQNLTMSLTQSVGYCREVKVDADLGRKLQPGNRRQQSQTMLELPLLLNCLKLVASEGAENAVQTWRLLGEERWLKAGTDPGSVQYQCLDHSLELMLGYIDAYRDAWRKTKGKASLCSALTQAPLLVWHSAWLDLSGFDLLVYLRMQQAVQWQLNCLDLNGVTYAPLSQLLAGIPEQALRSRGHSVLDKCYSFIRRLMKQLMAHGATKPLNGFEAYPFDPIPDTWSGTAVAWQVSDILAMESEIELDRRQAAVQFGQRFLFDCEQTLHEVFGFADTAQVRKLAFEAKAATFPGKLRDASLSLHPQAQIYLILPLFCEWNLRSFMQGRFALPQPIRDSLLAPLLDPQSSLGFAERYQRFSHMIESQGFYRDFICQELGATLMHPEWTNGAEAISIAVGTLEDPVLPRVALVEAPQPVSTPVIELGEKISSTPEHAHRVIGFSKAAQSRLEKIAADELDRLLQAQPKKYQDLLGQFFASLDQESKRMLMELRQNLKQELFEQHIRKRLIQYMLSKPAEWSQAAAQST